MLEVYSTIVPKKKPKRDDDSEEEKPEIDVRFMTNLIYSANFDYN